MSVTDLQANRLLDQSFGAVSWSVPATLYFGLSTTSINDDGTGETEPVGGSYARASVSNNKTTWGNASGATLSNDIEISFAESSGSWGTVTHVFIADALSGGNILYFDALSPSRSVQTLTTVLFAIGSIDISMVNV